MAHKLKALHAYPWAGLQVNDLFHFPEAYANATTPQQYVLQEHIVPEHFLWLSASMYIRIVEHVWMNGWNYGKGRKGFEKARALTMRRPLLELLRARSRVTCIAGSVSNHRWGALCFDWLYWWSSIVLILFGRAVVHYCSFSIWDVWTSCSHIRLCGVLPWFCIRVIAKKSLMFFPPWYLPKSTLASELRSWGACFKIETKTITYV